MCTNPEERVNECSQGTRSTDAMNDECQPWHLVCPSLNVEKCEPAGTASNSPQCRASLDWELASSAHLNSGGPSVAAPHPVVLLAFQAQGDVKLLQAELLAGGKVCDLPGSLWGVGMIVGGRVQGKHVASIQVPDCISLHKAQTCGPRESRFLHLWNQFQASSRVLWKAVLDWKFHR